MKRFFKYKGFVGTVESDSPTHLHGRVKYIKDCVIFDGRTVKELRTAFRHAVDGYLEVCQEVDKFAAGDSNTPRRVKF